MDIIIFKGWQMGLGRLPFMSLLNTKANISKKSDRKKDKNCR